jgi:hypothetical protein
MNTRLVTAFALLSMIASGFSEPSDKEAIALINKVELRVNGGDTSALNDLMVLPGKMAVPAYLNFFKNNYNIFGATRQNRGIGEKAAELATKIPGGEEYLVKLLKKKPDDSPNWVFAQQSTGIKALICANNKTAVRILCGALDEPEIGGRAANALANLGIPGAPYSSNNKGSDATSNAEGIAKWKKWWNDNAYKYAP